MRKLNAFFLAILLAACIALPTTGMPATKTTPELKSASATQPSLATPGSTTTEIPLAGTPTTVEGTQTPLPRLETSSPLTLASIYMITSNIGWGIEKDGYIVRTTDGGFTWQDVTPAQAIYNRGGFFALDANTAWAVQDILGNNILRTTNGGQSWELAVNPAADSLPVDLRLNLYFLDAQTGWFFGERAGHGIAQVNLANTTDGGKTWVRNNFYGDYGFYTDMLIIDKSTLYLSGGIWGDVRDNGRFSVLDYLNGEVTPDLEKTSDGGKTWNIVALPAVSPVPAELTVLASPNKLMSCRTDSVRFIHRYSQRITASVSCQVGTEKNGTQWFYDVFHYFSDDGENWHVWQPAPEDNAVNDFISPVIGWRQVSGADKQSCQLQKTIDDGQSWDTLKTTIWCATQLDFVDGDRGWALATAGDVTALLHTVDGGKTWDELKPIVAP